MDPLTAFSLAANVVSIVDVTFRVVKTTRQIASAGEKVEFNEIESQTEIVRSLLERLRPALNAGDSISTLPVDDQSLIRLCEQSRDVSEQLLQVLDKCKTHQGTSKLTTDSFCRAIRSEWSKSTVKDLQNRLESIDAKVHRVVAVQYAARILEALKNVEQQYDRIGSSHADELRSVQKSIQDLVKAEESRKGISKKRIKAAPVHKPRRDPKKIAEAQRNRDAGEHNFLVADKYNAEESHKKAEPSRANAIDEGELSKWLMLKAAHSGGLSKEYAVQAGILGQLRFEGIDRRLFDLSKHASHENSYDWLTDHGKNKCANFTAWLTSSGMGSMYWISGVPGSGKSTIMKSLFSDQETMKKLGDWTGGKRLVSAAFFFWEVGKIEMLRSKEGLVRTLLFQILRQCPELIAEVYSDLWMLFTDAMPNHNCSVSSFAGSHVSLELPELVARLRAACDIISKRDWHLLLLVDGSDEYFGKPREVIELLQQFSKFPNVKLCVASRPENEFMEAYDGMATRLFMEDFNKADIEAYVRAKLESHARFKDSDDKDTLGAELIKTVVSRSNGVFLWVRLVMEELREGLTNRDTIAKLQTRLNLLPQKLETFYNHMLDRVSQLDREDSASMLTATVETQDLLPPMAYWFMSEGPHELDINQDVKPTDFRHNFKRRTDIEARLRSVCRGLLVVQESPLAQKFAALPSSSLFGQCVIFLHRTVREWLRVREVQQRLDGWRPNGFDVDELLCKAVLAQVRTSPTDFNYFDKDGPIEGLLKTFIAHHASLCGRQNAQAGKLLEAMAAVLSKQRNINGHDLRIESPVSTSPTNGPASMSVAERSVSQGRPGSSASVSNENKRLPSPPPCHLQDQVRSVGPSTSINNTTQDTMAQRRSAIPLIAKEKLKRLVKWKMTLPAVK